MRAAFVTKPYKVEIKDAPRPKAGESEVLIRVELAGVCGSDLHLFKGTHAFRKLPAILGHEMAGEVVESGTPKFKPGERVTVEPQIGCGQCCFCRAGDLNLCAKKLVPGTPGWLGTFVEYFPAPERAVYRLNDDIPFESGVLIEPLAVAVHALRAAGKGETMAVLGCGTIGLMCVALAKRYGYKSVMATDIAPFNRSLALKLGADCAVNPASGDVLSAARELAGEGVDSAVIAAGAAGIVDQASSVTRRQGRVALVSMMTKPIEVYTYSYVFKEQTLAGVMTYSTGDFAEACGLINGGFDLSALVTHILPMGKTQRALELLSEKVEDVGKILINPYI